MNRVIPQPFSLFPFGDDMDGFHERWWSDLEIDISDELWSFFYNDNEVARALVSRGSTEQEYEIPLKSTETIDITYFEVRKAYRNKEFGREAVHLLILDHPDSLITAFSIADGFWEKVGFTYYPRKDKKDGQIPDKQTFNPLYVYNS